MRPRGLAKAIANTASDATDFSAIFDALPGNYLVLCPDYPRFTILAISQAYANAIRVTKKEVAGRSVFEVVSDEAGQLRASLSEVVATKAVHAIRPIGSEDYSSNSPVLGDDGELRFIVYRADAPREARFKAAFSQAPVGMVLLSPEGELRDFNQSYMDMLGYGREELLGKNSSDFTHPGDIAKTREFFSRLREGPQKKSTIEKRYVRKNGQVLSARTSATMRRDAKGAPTEVVAIIEDITERKRAEERYHFLAESIPQMVWTATPDGMLDYVNARGVAYFGVSQEVLLGAGWLQWVHPDEKESAVQIWTRSLETGNRYETTFRLKRGSDASWRWHLVRGLPLAGEHGKVVQWFGTCTDIEDQKQAEANLQQQWHSFDTAISNTPDLTYVLDTSGRFTYANRALLSLWQKPLEDVIGKSFFDLDYPAELAERLQRQIHQVVDEKSPLRDQTPFTGPDGKTGHYDYIFVPVLDNTGQVRAISGTTRDITEQNRAGQQIEQDRRRWRELLLQTPAAIAVLRGSDHCFEWVNPDYEQLVGRPATVLIGRTLHEALPEIATETYLHLLDQVYRTGEPWIGHESHIRLNRGDDELRDFYVNFIYLPTRDADGSIDGIFIHVTDVTSMVIARKRLEESEGQFRTLAETIPHLAWMADPTGHIFWYNRRWYDYTGKSPAEVKGWGWQTLHDPHMLPEVLKNWARAISSGEPFEMVFPLKSADGTFRDFLTRIEPVKDSSGALVRWFGTNTDISAQKGIEEELRRMNRELEEFAYVASHDLQEPLRMVNIYTQLILKHPSAAKDRLLQYSAFVEQGVHRMEALIHDLLSFSRSVHTEASPMGTADLSLALVEAMSVLESRIEETGAVIEAVSLPSVRGDTAQLAHVLQNILSNALKYRKPESCPEVHISTRLENEMWIVSIRDEGIGFDPQYSERIFGLFKRLHKEEYPGTGLGLAICKRIIERYGGRIWAEGKLDEGATFHFELPRA